LSLDFYSLRLLIRLSILVYKSFCLRLLDKASVHVVAIVCVLNLITNILDINKVVVKIFEVVNILILALELILRELLNIALADEVSLHL